MRQALQCRSTTAAAAASSAGRDYGFENFREMVVAIFSRSRKVALYGLSNSELERILSKSN